MILSLNKKFKIILDLEGDCYNNSMETRPVINIEKTWINILNLMEKSGITKKDLAEIFRISVQAVYQKFNPKSLPTLEQIVVLSKIFEKPVEEILIIENSEEDESFEAIIKKAHENNRQSALYNLSVHTGNIVCEDVETYFNDFFSREI